MRSGHRAFSNRIGSPSAGMKADAFKRQNRDRLLSSRRKLSGSAVLGRRWTPFGPMLSSCQRVDLGLRIPRSRPLPPLLDAFERKVARRGRGFFASAIDDVRYRPGALLDTLRSQGRRLFVNHYLRFCGCRIRTPAPPPFSAMNWTPASLKVRSITANVSGSPAYRPVSKLVIVFRWSPEASAKSRTDQFSAARAIRTCALVTGMILCFCHMCR